MKALTSSMLNPALLMMRRLGLSPRHGEADLESKSSFETAKQAPCLFYSLGKAHRSRCGRLDGEVASPRPTGAGAYGVCTYSVKKPCGDIDS